jgi:outer membrane protein TolC
MDNKQSDPASATLPLPGTGTALGFNGVNGRYNPDFFVTDPMDVSRWHVLGNFSASLTLSAALGAGIQAVRRDYQAGALSFEKAKIQTERDVRKAYYQILLLRENAALLMESVAATQRQVDMAQANYNAGLAPELTLLQAQVALANMRPTIDQMENGLKIAQANFAMILGLPYDTEFELIPIEDEDSFIPLDLAELISQASRNKPDILELKANILTMQSSRKAQALQLWTPYLRLGWTVAPTFAGDPFEDSWSDSDLWMDRGAFSITLGMSFNGLFPFTKEGQGLKDLDNTRQIASIGLAQMIQGTELEVYNTVLSLDRIRASTEAQGRTVDLAQQSYRSTEAAYRAGLQDLLQVQNAELELRRARLGVLEQQFNYLNGLIDLEYDIGVPFGTLARSAK